MPHAASRHSRPTRGVAIARISAFVLSVLTIGSLVSSIEAPWEASEVSAQRRRRVPPPPRWVSDNTLWPAQYIPYVATGDVSSMTMECAPYPADSPRVLRCNTKTRRLEVESLAAPYEALLASTQPGELERGLEAARRRECGADARRLERPLSSWSPARREGLEAHNRRVSALRELVCPACRGPQCRETTARIAEALNAHACSVAFEEGVIDLTPTGAMRWGTETPDETCGGRLSHSFRAQGRNWVYTRTRHYDEGDTPPSDPTLRARCEQSANVTMGTDEPAFASVSMCDYLTL